VDARAWRRRLRRARRIPGQAERASAHGLEWRRTQTELFVRFLQVILAVVLEPLA